MSKNVINLFFAVDDNYCPYLSVALDSIMKNANKDYNYNAYVLATYVSPENKKTLEDRLYDNFTIEFVDMTDKLEMIADKLHTRDYYSKTTYYRLFIPNMFPNMDKALYLDADIVVPGDISELYNVDLGNNLVGGITDSAVANNDIFVKYVEEVVGVDKSDDYFNAGILPMNLKAMREFEFEEKFLNLLVSYKFVVAQDQDYLNAICKGRVRYIDDSWNVMPIENNKRKIDKLNLIHYNMLWKPWQFDNIMYEEYFWEYAKSNPYYEFILNSKATWTEERRAKAMASGGSLLDRCLQDIADPNNYKRKFMK